MKSIPLSILIVDDDRNIRSTLAIGLRELGYHCELAESVQTAMVKIRERSFDVVLTDFRMEKGTGLDLVRSAREARPDIFVVVMTAFASIPNAVAVVKEGAYDYLPKPFSNAQLAHLLARIEEILQLQRENEELKRYRYRRDYFSGMTSLAMTQLEEFIKKVAPSEGTVLLSGESGTGKSELARLIHELSPRRKKTFISVYCTTIVESLFESELFGHAAGAFTGASSAKVGKFELADGGTLFLDEIGDLSTSAQAKLLRFLQDRVVERVGSNEEIVVNARIIAATNKNLEELVKEGKFREDLYFRLNTLECPLAPLRHRREDVPVLIHRFIEESRITSNRSVPLECPKPVYDRLLGYPWPGNVRELRNVIERLNVLATNRPATLEDLPKAIQTYDETTPPVLGETRRSLEAIEKEHIESVLRIEPNFERAAQILGITSVTLWRKRKQYGLQ